MKGAIPMLFQITAEHLAQALDENKEIFVFLVFYAPWCAPCRALSPIMDALSDRYEEVLTAYAVNVDTEEALAAQYHVTVVPTVLVLRNGEILKRYETEITEEMLQEIL